MKSKLNPLLCSLIAASALALAGCASVGNESLRAESESSVGKKLVEGKTTKAEVRALYGSPGKTSFTDGGLEMWTYELAKMSADGVSYIPIVSLFGASSSGTKKELVILFDAQSVIRRFSMSESPVTVKTGIFNK